MASYKLPPDWAEVQAKPTTLATYMVAKDGQETELTLIAMPQMPDHMLLANINRWRVQQLQLPPIEAQDVPSAMLDIPIGNLKGRYLKLVGPETPKGQNAILVAFLDHGGMTWYFKLFGDAPLTLQEEVRFQTSSNPSAFPPTRKPAMSKPRKIETSLDMQNTASQEASTEESAWEPAGKAVANFLHGLASLRLTVALFAMAIFIVLAGTLGQVHRDIWDVIHDYFRMDLSSNSPMATTVNLFGKELILPSPVTWIDLSIFFPPSFFADQIPPDLSAMTSPARLFTSFLLGFGWAALVWLVPQSDKKYQFGVFAALGLTLSLCSAKFNGLYFPKGWTIGAVMAVNLLSAHLIRFKIQSKGARLWAGVGVIGLGILATIAVIQSGSNKEGVLKENFLGGMEFEWSTIWVLFEFTLAMILVFGVWGYISLWRRTLKNPDLTQQERSATVIMRRIVGFSNLALAAILIYLIQGGDQTQLNDSGMRILWQLLKATAAGLILLAGCVLVFKKRAGVVVLHFGVALVMLSELLVGVAAVESQMQIIEGESSNFVQDIREVEIAVTDTSGEETDRVVAIPMRFLQEENLIKDDRLPVNIQVDQYYKHSFTERPTAKDENPATEGAGLARIARPAQGSTGAEGSSSVDMASAYVTLFSKTSDGENDRNLGTWLISQHLNDQPFEVGDETYQIALRFKRTYKPYTITLKQAIRENYVGTNTPKDYRSIVDLKDDSKNEDRKDIHIWMNNPLRFGGETFYQSGLDEFSPGVNYTVLQIVTNDGWMIPYVACMIVWVGMMSHFMIGLTRFLNRESKPAASKLGFGPSATDTGFGDPLHEPSKRPWLTPALSVCLILIFGGYLASKARPPKPTEEGFNFYQAGKIPVAYKGRVKPLDTLARNSLRIMSNKQQFVDANGDEQPAMRWLMDLIVDPDRAAEHPVVRIDYQPLLDTLKLTKRKGYLYSFEEITQEAQELSEQIQRAGEASSAKKPLNTYQKKVLELDRKLQVYRLAEVSFTYSKAEGKDALDTLLTSLNINQNLKKMRGDPPLVSSQSTGDWEMYNTTALRHQILKLAETHNAKTADELAQSIVEDFETPLASFAIKDVRAEVSREAKTQHKTFAETAKALASSTNDANQKAVYQVLAESSPRDKDLALAERLPKDVVNALAQKEAPLFLSRKSGGDERLVELLMQKVAGGQTNRAIFVLETMLAGLMGEILEDKPLADLPPEAPFEEIFESYKNGKADEFNTAVETYLVSLEEHPVYDHNELVTTEKLSFEAFFNNAEPFFYLAAVYLMAGLLAAGSWLTCYRPLNRATFYLLCFALIVHTAALIGRIYISGRPPVTNLYSSAVFIGWGCVLMGLMFEWFYDIGLGNLVAAVAGFMTLGVAHLLTTGVPNFKGDSFEVMQAVLDTQFWLATHVVCISMGYATTFVAGFLGIAYILGGAFTPLLTAPRRKDLLRMMYATLCFAIFFSFVGTVLGGLWADDSWGRFWGWDTKENGALIIVLWNALVLHARWGGIVKDKGLAVLAVAGNIAVSWSWFGVNELGIGLHSYGVTEGVMFMLFLFWVSQLLIVAIGLLPKEFWWSHIAEQTEAKA